MDFNMLPSHLVFPLPEGPFGYSYQIVDSRIRSILARGGQRNVDDLWLLPGCGFDDLGTFYAGLYMNIVGTPLPPSCL